MKPLERTHKVLSKVWLHASRNNKNYFADFKKGAVITKGAYGKSNQIVDFTESVRNLHDEIRIILLIQIPQILEA